MEEHDFWLLIAQSREETDECEKQSQKLSWLLSARSANEILSFDEHFAKKRKEAYRWNLWGAAYVINGGCSDDGFEYFRCWLIAQGREVYNNALQNPDSLADILSEGSEEAECEDILYAADEAYQDLRGESLPERQFSEPIKPEGTQWEESTLESLYPRLSEIFL